MLSLRCIYNAVHKLTFQYPRLTCFLIAFLKAHVEKEAEDFQFTNIAYNEDVTSTPHVDYGTLRLPMIAGLGCWKGGELVVEDDQSVN